MAILTVWRLATPDGAEQLLNAVSDLQKQELIKVHDAAVVSWPPGAKKPKTRQARNLAAAGAMTGAFWGMLFGLLFFVPLLGMAMGAAAGALGGSMADVGIDDSFIKRVRDSITPGTSAVFLMTSDAVVDRVVEALRGFDAELIQTNLSRDQEAKLREVFAEES
jgi:uncharacterized membrane protein